MERTPGPLSEADEGGFLTAADDAPGRAGELEYRLALADLVTTILTRFVHLSSEDINHGIQKSLGEIGKFFKVDRVRILIVAGDGVSFEGSHDWCAAGVETPPIHQHSGHFSTFPWACDKLARGETVRVEQVSRMGTEAAAEKAAMQARRVRSVLVQPIMVGKELLGAALLEWVRVETSWSEESLKMFGVIIHVIAGAMARKRAHHQLRASEEKFRGFVEQINEVLYSIDTEGVITYVSPAVESSGGYQRSELVGRQFLDFVHPDDRTIVFERYSRALVRNRGPSEYRVLSKSGEVRWARSDSYLIREHGQVVGLRAVLMDITGRKQAELALEQRELRWRSLIEHSSDGIVLLDCDDVIQYASPGALKVLGLQAEEMIGRRGIDFIHPDDVKLRTEAKASLAAMPGASLMVTMRLRHRDGSWRWVEAVGTDLRDDPSVGAIIINYHDVTDSRRAAEGIDAANRDLERRVAERTAELAATNTELESFSYSVSHDLRSPLRIIDAWSQILLEEHRDNLRGDGPEMLAQIRRSVHRMGRLIDDLLNLSRVSRANMRHELVDMGALASSVVADLIRLEPERAVEFVIDGDIVAVGDSGLLRVVLENLIGNAWKFTGKNEQTCIEFGRKASETPGTAPIFFVRDNGVGFDMRFVARLFGPFQRLHGVTEFPGTGVGLATVQRIVARHGGRVWAEAELGEGATFNFTLERDQTLES